MRDGYSDFVSRGVEILAIGTDSASSFESYWKQENIPYLGLSDPKASVPRLYKQEVNLFKLGRMPAQVIVDQAGVARFVHYGHSMSDIPPNEEVLALLDQLSVTVETIT